MGTNEIFNVKSFILEGLDRHTMGKKADTAWGKGVIDGAWAGGYISIEEHSDIQEWFANILALQSD